MNLARDLKPRGAPRRGPLLVAAFSLLLLPAHARAEWVAAWTAAPFPAIRKLVERDERSFAHQTIRQTVRLAASGNRIRLRLTNEIGTTPLSFAQVHAAILGSDGRTKPGTDHRVLFFGRSGGTIAAGAPLLSDPLALEVAAGDSLAVSVYYRAAATPAAHLLEVQLAPGNQSAAPVLAGARAVRAPALAAAIETEANEPVIVAFGDSITEGDGSTPGAHKDWPSQLAERLRGVSVVNQGINGNRVIRAGAGQSGLSRFDRDALAVAGVTQIVLLEGINDIGWGSQADRPEERVEAAELIAAYRQLIDRAHARGIRICGGTLLPYRGAIYWTAAGEAKRQAANAWIRTSGAFDCVIDFDKALADPADPSALARPLHRGDHLHPNDAGYAAMAKAAEQALGPGPSRR